MTDASTKNLENAVAAAMTDMDKSPSLQVRRSEVSDIERLMNTGERLLREQQDKLVGEKANYEEARTSLVNAYAAAQAKLDRDTADRAHRLLLEHNDRVAEIERLIAKLKALREA